MKIIERIHDIATGEIVDIEREETAEEKAEREAFEAKRSAEMAELAAKEDAKKALLEKLGITEDEAKLILP